MIFRKKYIGLILSTVVLFTIVIQSFVFNNPEIFNRKSEVTDYSAYFVAGSLVNQGRPADAYDWPATRAEQLKDFHDVSFMPWAYPPQFTTLVSYLSRLPIGTGYLIFEIITFLSFLIILNRLSGDWFSMGLVFVLPAILINARCGQNGFLTASLIGVFLLYAETRWLRAGLALGAMVVKPHLAIAISFMALIKRNWAAMTVAAVVVAASSLAATFLLGSSIWPQFLAATQVAGDYMQQGLFPLERMTSVYAALFRLGVGAPIALAAHVAVAIAMLGWLFVALSGTMARNRQLALAALCSLFISPYNYDYDLVLLAMFAGLMASDIVSRATTAEVMGLVLLGWAASSNHLISQAIIAVMDIQIEPEEATGIPSFSLYFLAAIIAWGLLILRRPGTTEAAASGKVDADRGNSPSRESQSAR